MNPNSIWKIAATLSLATMGLLPAACSSDPATEVAGASDDAIVAHRVNVPRTTCTATATGTTQTLTLDTITPCPAGACPMNTLGTPRAHVTSTASSATQTSTTTWSVGAAGTTFMSATVSVAGTVTTTQYSYGAALTGATTGTFRSDGATVTGSIDGRVLVPMTLATYKPADGVKFADGKPAPTLSGNALFLSDVRTLLVNAGTDAISACGASAPALVVSRAKAAVWANFTSATLPTPGAFGPPPVSGTPAPAPAATVTPADGQPGYVSSGMGDGATVKNSPFNWATPGCQQCESDCGTSILDWLTGFGLALCEAECLFPGKGCNERSWCDRNQAGCNELCCGPSQVCGNEKYGSCCPKDHPVGCGDMTKVGCFPAGSTCCGEFVGACGPGEACIGTGASATCCPKSQLDKNGLCCASGILCGGVCCTGGSCVNGQCCFGPTSAAGQCCGLGDTVVNGQCCPQRQACGSACCGNGLSCLNAATSQCGFPINTCNPGKVICNYGDTRYCCAPDERCNGSIPGCCGDHNPSNNCGIK